GFYRRPVGLLRGGQFQAVLDSRDLDVAQQRVVLLRLRLGDSLGLRQRGSRCRGRRNFLRQTDIGRSGRRISLAQRLAQRRGGLRRLVGGQRVAHDGQPVLLVFLV